MGELEEKLENILGDPQAMSQIMALAQSLSQGGQGGNGPARTPPPMEQTQDQGADLPPGGGTQRQGGDAPTIPAGAAGIDGLLGALGGLDAGTLSAAADLISRFSNDGDDRRTALLTALRPFVREERYAKLDKAIQIAKLSRLIRSGLELLRQRKEDSHV